MFKSFAFASALIALSLPTSAQACAPPLVIFAFGSARIPADGRGEVELFSKEARMAYQARVKLTATTDGSKSNVKMSRRRVEAIKAALARGGVSTKRIDVEYIRATSDSSARIVMMEIASSPTCGA